jgi:hypothetical protein
MKKSDHSLLRLVPVQAVECCHSMRVLEGRRLGTLQTDGDLGSGEEMNLELTRVIKQTQG